MRRMTERIISQPLSLLCLLSFALIAFGALLIRATSPHSPIGSALYDRRRNRRLVGIGFLVAGILFFGLALSLLWYFSQPDF